MLNNNVTAILIVLVLILLVYYNRTQLQAALDQSDYMTLGGSVVSAGVLLFGAYRLSKCPEPAQ